MTLALQAAAAPSISRSIRNPTLREALADAGVTVIPAEKVRAHKRALAKKELGPWEPVITFLDRLLWIPRLYFVTRFLEWATGRRFGPLHALFVVLAFGANFFGPYAGQTWSWLLMVPLLASIPSMLAHAICFLFLGGNWRDMGSWRHMQVGASTGPDGDPVFPPQRLVQREMAAKKLPNARLLIEYRGGDPFLVVVSCWNPFSRHHIGAWDTGNRELDNY
jgi:hypothetical protein